MASGEGYLADTIMHEISHGLGPAFAHTAQGKVQINEAIGSSYSALEESKADVVGEFCYGWLIDHGVLPKERRNITYASYVAGIFRTVRFGVAEAHGAGEIMQFNYYVEQGAISRDAATGLYVIDFDKDARGDCVACERIAGAGSHRGSRAHRCVVQEIWHDAGGIERAAGEDERHSCGH